MHLQYLEPVARLKAVVPKSRLDLVSLKATHTFKHCFLNACAQSFFDPNIRQDKKKSRETSQNQDLRIVGFTKWKGSWR